MFKNILFITLFSFFFSALHHVEARIVEITHVSEILPEITQDTLVLMDLDDTCVTSMQTLGNTPWWDYVTKKMLAAQIDNQTTFNVVFPLVGKIIKSLPLKPIESSAPQMIRELQEQNILVWALTGRVKEAPYDPNFAQTTRDHLQKAGFDFQASHIPPGINLSQPPKTFAHGIIFSSHRLKGPVLKEFLKEINYRPAKIVMAEDHLGQLSSVECSMNELGIPFVGFHYNRPDSTFETFDPMIGNLQLKALLTQGYVPTDEQALLWKAELLEQNPNLSPDFYLNELIAGIMKKAEEKKKAKG